MPKVRERKRWNTITPFFPFHAAGVDYISIPGLELVFNDVVTSRTVPVSVIDDGRFELTESFSGLLTPTALPSNVRLDPDIATGRILEEGGQ